MQTAVDHLTAKQVHENPRRTKKDDSAKDQTVVDDRIDDGVLIKISPLVSRRREGGQKRKGQERRQRNQIDQYRATAQKVLLDFEAKDRADLPEPESPARRHLFRSGFNYLYRRTHLLTPRRCRPWSRSGTGKPRLDRHRPAPLTPRSLHPRQRHGSTASKNDPRRVFSQTGRGDRRAVVLQRRDPAQKHTRRVWPAGRNESGSASDALPSRRARRECC